MSGCLTKSGTTISALDNVEVPYISRNGLVLLIGDDEYYLPYSKFPWFRGATADQVLDVRVCGRNRIRWETLDVDLSLSILANPDAYPLISK